MSADMSKRNPQVLSGIMAAAPETKRGFNMHISASKRQNCLLYTNGRTIFMRNLDDPTNVRIYAEHKSKVNVAKFSPNGRKVASGDAEGNVIIWEILSNRFSTRNTFPICDSVNDIAWSPDNKRIIIGGKSNGNKYSCVILIDSGNTVGSITGHSAHVLSVDYKPTRPYRAVTGGEDNITAFHKGPPFKFEQSYKGNTNYVQCVRYSPDGNLVASVSSDKTVKIFDAKTGDYKHDIKQKRKTGHKGTIYSVAWSGDSKQLLTSSADKQCKLWDLETKKHVKTFNFSANPKRPELTDMQVSCLWFEDHMISVSLSGAINFMDIENPDTPKRVLHGCMGNIKSLCVDREAKVAYTGEVSGQITAWDLKTNTGKWFSGKKPETAVAHLVCTSSNVLAFTLDDKVRHHDAKNCAFADDKKVAPVAIGGFPKAVAQSNTNPNLSAVACSNGKIVLIQDGKVLLTQAITYDPLSIAFSHDDTKLFCGGKNRKALVYNLDIATPALTKTDTTLDVNDHCLHICPSPDGKLVCVLDKKRSLCYFDTSTWEYLNPIDTYRNHLGSIRGGAWSPDGSKFATFGNDSKVIVWYDGASGHHLKFEAHTQSVSQAAWVDDTTLVSAGDDRVLKQWTIPATWS